MFNVGGAELFIILLLALIVLGPEKLPGAMRTVGQWVGEMRKMANGFQAELNKVTTDPLDTKGAQASGAAKAGDVEPPSKRTTSSADDDGKAHGAGTNGASTNGSGHASPSAADGAAPDAPSASDDGEGSAPTLDETSGERPESG